MIDEKLKSYTECENCWKAETCLFYEDVKDTIEKFKNTPLNIHFPLCNEHESYLYKKLKGMEIHNFKQEHDCIWNKGEE